MTMGVSIFVIAVGAILYFAVSASVKGLNLDAVGVILMIVGALGLVISAAIVAMTRGRGRGTYIDRMTPVQRSTTVVNEDLR